MKSRLLALLLAGVMAVQGCAFKFTKSKKSFVYPAASIEASVDVVRYNVDIDEELQTIYVHPKDGGPSKGGVIASVNGNYWDYQPRLGLEGSLGIKQLRFKIGGDIRYNNVLSDSYEYRKGNYEVTLQPLPPPYESYGFSQLKAGKFIYTPLLGLEANIKRVKLSAELGYPYTSLKFRSGHDRWGKWETINRESWKGFGKSFTGNIGYKFDVEEGNPSIVSFFLRKEKYKPKIPISTFAFGFEFGYEF